MSVAPAPHGTSPRVPSPEEWKGVGGWLAFFVFSLVILGAYYAVFHCLFVFRDIRTMAGEFPLIRVAAVIYLLDNLAWIAVRSYGVYAGILLWRIRPGAVAEAKRFLIVLVAMAMVQATGFLVGTLTQAEGMLSEALASDQGLRQVLIGTLQALFFAVLWHEYLSRSVRVRFTYGPPEVQS
jgi:hypothetical protein